MHKLYLSALLFQKEGYSRVLLFKKKKGSNSVLLFQPSKNHLEGGGHTFHKKLIQKGNNLCKIIPKVINPQNARPD